MYNIGSGFESQFEIHRKAVCCWSLIEDLRWVSGTCHPLPCLCYLTNEKAVRQGAFLVGAPCPRLRSCLCTFRDFEAAQCDSVNIWFIFCHLCSLRLIPGLLVCVCFSLHNSTGTNLSSISWCINHAESICLAPEMELSRTSKSSDFQCWCDWRLGAEDSGLWAASSKRVFLYNIAAKVTPRCPPEYLSSSNGLKTQYKSRWSVFSPNLPVKSF